MSRPGIRAPPKLSVDGKLPTILFVGTGSGLGVADKTGTGGRGCTTNDGRCMGGNAGVAFGTATVDKGTAEIPPKGVVGPSNRGGAGNARSQSRSAKSHSKTSAGSGVCDGSAATTGARIPEITRKLSCRD